MEHVYGTLKYKLLPQIFPIIYQSLPNKKKFGKYHYYCVPKKSNVVLVWFKQGGMALENGLYSESKFLTNMADKLNVSIMAFDYPVAPDAKFPQQPLLCYDFYHFIKDMYPTRRILVGGASAGGNLLGIS